MKTIWLTWSNGAGKSTLYHLMTGLIEPKQGKILIENKDVTNFPVYLRTRQYGIGYVPQYGGAFVIYSS